MTGRKAKTDRFINRELSWLNFNRRVLEEAVDPRNPLLERVKFLMITASNMDEFFMVRVGGLQMMVRQGRRAKDASGMTPRQQLTAVSRAAHDFVARQTALYREDLEPRLAEQGLRRVRPHAMDADQEAYAERIFHEQVLPVLTPMAVRDEAPFPLLRNLGLVMAVLLEDGHAALIPLQAVLDRFVILPSEGGTSFLLFEDLVRAFVDRFFLGERVAEAAVFRMTRNADLSVREDQAADLLARMEDVLDARKQSECIRLEIEDGVSDRLLGFLMEHLGVEERELYRIAAPLDFSTFKTLAFMEGYENLKIEPWPPCSPPGVPRERSMLDRVAEESILLMHPYESFDPVVRLVEDAADDPDVLAIKQILYRTSVDSPMIAALQRAAARGKSVTAIVELKARFEEARNIEWARRLEQEGVQVIYGVKGLKTHAKLLLIIRRQPHGIERIMHFGTGNYNDATARLYGDISYMTADHDLGRDASAFFHCVTGFSEPGRLMKLSMAPLTLRETLMDRIDDEIERSRQGQPARILAKMNSLVDPVLIDKLCEASQAGVGIELNVRGICCLRPGLPGVSERIRVVSIVDRFLEHARIFYFHHGGDEQVFISSADWMPRNLDRRVELLVPVDEKDHRRRLTRILKTCLKDNVKAWELTADGTYVRLSPRGRKGVRSQEVFYREAVEALEEARKRKRTTFEPHVPPTDETA